ncbi:hypothetical protein [Nocardiopsis halotolerans]|uniref:hypothetical protein n=1 Tax=Nocardiopsis halotolerans TaxID=124252 RepID=UPI0003471F1E|nr:hypothetical protein [Nocardiopsis halotolerans]
MAHEPNRPSRVMKGPAVDHVLAGTLLALSGVRAARLPLAAPARVLLRARSE